jgi:tetratricopeptide (TPR) repeat protein
MHQGGRPDVSGTGGPSAPAGYRLIHLLGRGGMGEVYLADDLRLNRKVAIKFLLADKSEDQAARRRLLHEAQAAAAVDHPCICAVYETGDTPDGDAYIVMQYVDGEPLSALLQRGPVPVRQALELCGQIADALSTAHHQGIIHRDLKPANVIVTKSGRPKILDLGIAKVMTSAANAETALDTGSTAAGDLVGTAGYMSPEQVQQRPLDGRCDLFSLGALLFECLTGRRAFDGSTTFETLANVLHVHPPAPSQLRSELTAAHDELCRRLLAKDPADRFQSADEVVGAIRLLAPDTSRTTGHAQALEEVLRAGKRSAWSRRANIFAGLALIGVAALSVWLLTRPRGLPPVPADAARWYEIGSDAVREGAYVKGLRALDEAVTQFPEHVLAYARRAEAHAELDEPEAAKDQLLYVARLVPNETRLPRVERLRIQAVRALVVRDVDSAVSLYRELVGLVSDESRAWLDLGRAQESAGLRLAAVESYRRAVQQDSGYAAAHLRLAIALALEAKGQEALAAFADAERLYRASSNQEGETEVLLGRGLFYDSIVQPAMARKDLERAQILAAASDSINQQVRIQLALSSVTASEGKVEEALRIAGAAVQRATDNGLETIAADGLIDLASLVQADGADLAASQLELAIRLAQKRGARRTEARARLQLASVRQRQGRYADSLTLVESELPFLRDNRYRRYELFAGGIQSRALIQLDRLEEARQHTTRMLATAEAVHDEAQVALASANLAAANTQLGAYPEALVLRERAVEIRTRQGDSESLPFDFANRADLLIRLGRRQDADAALRELEAGIAAGTESYRPVERRVASLRALLAASWLDCDSVPRYVAQIQARSVVDSAGALTPAVGAFCEARRRRTVTAGNPAAGTEASVVRDRRYWTAFAALEQAKFDQALAEAEAGLAALGTIPHDELRWRLAAVGKAAAQARKDAARASALDGTARAALDRVRTAWKTDVDAYLRRPDLEYLRKRAELQMP